MKTLDSKPLEPRRTGLTLSCIAAALLAACGGGGGGGSDSGLSQDTTTGYAADATTMPQTATNGIDDSTVALESALSTSSPAAATDAQALGVETAQATGGSGSASCANGGTVAWTVTGSDPALLNNGQLDAGETYTVTYTGCKVADGTQIDGQTSLAVAARSATALDVTHTTGSSTPLVFTTALGQFTLSGTTRLQRSAAPTPSGDGGTEYQSEITSSNVTLTSSISTRQASYQLQSLDWTVVRDMSASGALESRTHNGSLSLVASTPRRPNATLKISTQGALTMGSDGLAAAGTLVIMTTNNTITVTYGNGTITVTLDKGNDGTIDNTWTSTRASFESDAG